jgi:hypothetical protein
MRVAIDAALKLRPRPHVIIVLTDGLTPWGDTPVQGVQVVAGIIGNHDVTTPKWVKAISIPREE